MPTLPAIRKQRKLSTGRFAAQCGVPYRVALGWERGIYPLESQAPTICAVLSLTPGELFEAMKQTRQENPLQIPPLSDIQIANVQIKIDRSGGPTSCWEWQGLRDRFGYGIWMSGDGARWFAHTIAFVLDSGTAKRGDYIIQTCGNRVCCNPAHLVPNSAKERTHT